MNNQQNIDSFFQRFQDKLTEAQKDANHHIEVTVVNSVLDNFRTESYFGDQWAKRKDKKNTRKLLVKSGILYRSVGVLRSQPGLVVIGSQIPYASVHNNGETINRASRSETFVRNRYKNGTRGKMFGGMGAFKKGTSPGKGQTYRAYSHSMPQRRFLGPHPILIEELKTVLSQNFTLKLK